MFFQAAGIEVDPWIPPLVALGISFFTSMGGVSGAFLLLPFQMSFFWYTNPSVSATNQFYNVVAIPGGVYRYWQEGRMVWPLTWVVVAGTLPGVFIGAFVRVAYLPDPRNFKLFAAMVLLYVGGKMVWEQVRRKGGRAENKTRSEDRFQKMMLRHRSQVVGQELPAGVLSTVTISHFNLKRLGYTFYGENFEVSVVGIFTLCFVVGIVGGVYGIGGGAIIAPFFVTLFGLPVYTIAGATLMGTVVTSVAGVIFYQVIAPYYPHVSVAPDIMLGVLFGIGGMVGMYLGARCQKFVPAKSIKWMLAATIVFMAAKYIAEFIRP